MTWQKEEAIYKDKRKCKISDDSTSMHWITMQCDAMHTFFFRAVVHFTHLSIAAVTKLDLAVTTTSRLENLDVIQVIYMSLSPHSDILFLHEVSTLVGEPIAYACD